MAIYFVGDIQGCYSELKALLQRVSFDAQKDQLWLVGDLVARGPQSLQTLRLVKSLGDSAKIVLGNHDLHLLATHAGLKTVKAKDHLTELLHAPDADELMHWLAQQPLMRKLPGHEVYMSHAGLPPQWTVAEAMKRAKKAQKKLSSHERVKWLSRMYGDTPSNWKKAKTRTERFRYTINAFTRMRFCYPDKSLEFTNKLGPKNAPKSLQPWFNMNQELNLVQWVFGHWAALMGKCPHANVYALDTGCVWGNELTMLRWHDKKLFIEPSHRHAMAR